MNECRRCVQWTLKKNGFLIEKKRILFYYPLLLCGFFRSFVGPILHSDLNHKSPGTKENEKINKSKQKKMKTRGRMWLFYHCFFPRFIWQLFITSLFLCQTIFFGENPFLHIISSNDSDQILTCSKESMQKIGIGNCLQTTSTSTFDCY